MYVTIKGTLDEARNEAVRREIPIRSIHAADATSSVIYTDDTQLLKVAKWFAEPAKTIEGEGYPVGTCLLYGPGHTKKAMAS